MYSHLENLVDSLTAYKSDFAVFPELFNGPLLANFNQMTEEQAKLAAQDLSLYEVKAELDRAIERRRQATEE